MRTPSSVQLLDAWERALTDPPGLRPAALLMAVTDGESLDVLAALPIGERDRRLLALREQTFGPVLTSVAECARCGERLEWTVRVSELRVPDAIGQTTDLIVEAAGYQVRCRLPDSHDLIALSALPEGAAARDALLRRCVVEAQYGGAPANLGDDVMVPAALSEAISARMADADPQADSRFHLTCPACGHQWTAIFDIGSFFWSEITAWAERVLKEVHTLAWAYGWRERDILELGAWRRQYYLNLVGV